MSRYYYYPGSGDVRGPVAITELQSLEASGVIDLHTSVRGETQEEWQVWAVLKRDAAPPPLPLKKKDIDPLDPWDQIRRDEVRAQNLLLADSAAQRLDLRRRTRYPKLRITCMVLIVLQGLAAIGCLIAGANNPDRGLPFFVAAGVSLAGIFPLLLCGVFFDLADGVQNLLTKKQGQSE
jgi:hypothetical protein